jgi:hypothetical protein
MDRASFAWPRNNLRSVSTDYNKAVYQYRIRWEGSSKTVIEMNTFLLSVLPVISTFATTGRVASASNRHTA